MIRRIGLDSMVFIYFFEKREPYGSIARDFIAQIENGKILAVTSFVTIIETLSVAKLQTNPVLYDDIVSFFQTTPSLTIVFPHWEVSLATARLRQKYSKLRTPDAIQLATAAIENVDYLVTNDKRLLHLPQPPVPIRAIRNLVE